MMYMYIEITINFVLCGKGRMDDLRFYILFNSVSFISGPWVDDNDKLMCAMEPNLHLRRFHLAERVTFLLFSRLI